MIQFLTITILPVALAQIVAHTRLQMRLQAATLGRGGMRGIAAARFGMGDLCVQPQSTGCACQPGYVQSGNSCVIDVAALTQLMQTQTGQVFTPAVASPVSALPVAGQSSSLPNGAAGIDVNGNPVQVMGGVWAALPAQQVQQNTTVVPTAQVTVYAPPAVQTPVQQMVEVTPVITTVSTDSSDYQPSTDDAFVFQAIAAASPYTTAEIAFTKTLEQYGSPMSSILNAAQIEQLWDSYVSAGYDMSAVVNTLNAAASAVATTDSTASASTTGSASLYIAAALGLAAYLFTR